MFDLTKTERIIVAVLVAALVLGCALIVLKKSRPHILPNAKKFSAEFLKSESLSDPRRRLNINTSSAAELEALKGVGRTLAVRIVEYRESSGPFASVEDINNVKGIGGKLFDDIKESICVE